MTTVYTTKGLLDRAELVARECVSENENSRVVATEWTHRGEIVRRDIHVIALRPMELGVKHVQ